MQIERKSGTTCAFQRFLDDLVNNNRGHIADSVLTSWHVAFTRRQQDLFKHGPLLCSVIKLLGCRVSALELKMGLAVLLFPLLVAHAGDGPL